VLVSAAGVTFAAIVYLLLDLWQILDVLIINANHTYLQFGIPSGKIDNAC